MASTTHSWTHSSVRTLAKSADPVEVVIRLARDTVLKAIELGWTGPPYDPITLAQILGFAVVPREDILDARTVSINQGKIQIEYNPNKPRGRQKYSIAHEIAHTLFPDCTDRVRYRQSRSQMSNDDWQLELLCNIAAAELLMPIGSFPDLQQSELSIEKLLNLRKEFDVSTEAIALRYARLTDQPCLVFCASRRESVKDRYFVDYTVRSRSWSGKGLRGESLPTTSIVKDCTAIGFTAKADEQWPGFDEMLHIEAVGIPPFPGHQFPRVVGFATPPAAKQNLQPHILTLKGDALQPRGEGFRIIAHIVNDKAARWGGGFALALRRKFPQVQADFIEWTSNHKNNFHLGAFQLCTVTDNLAVANMVCQHGPSSKPRIRYAALSDCLAQLKLVAQERKATIHMPRIGCGQAGGSWPVISELIEELICNQGIPVTIYDLPEQTPPEVAQSSLF